MESMKIGVTPKQTPGIPSLVLVRLSEELRMRIGRVDKAINAARSTEPFLPSKKKKSSKRKV